MYLIVDAHQDLAHNILGFGRDYTRSVMETRHIEKGTNIPERAGTALLGFPEAQKGNIALVFSTLFASPKRFQEAAWDTNSYSNIEEAHRLYRAQVDVY